MRKQWYIRYYSMDGDSPIAEFIDSLSPRAKAKVFNTFELLEEFGIQVGSPRIKKLVGTPLWEIRILGQESIRIFYVLITGNTFLLLHGFIKKKQKTPRKEIEQAMKKLDEYQSRR